MYIFEILFGFIKLEEEILAKEKFIESIALKFESKLGSINKPCSF